MWAESDLQCNLDISDLRSQDIAATGETDPHLENNIPPPEV